MSVTRLGVSCALCRCAVGVAVAQGRAALCGQQQQMQRRRQNVLDHPGSRPKKTKQRAPPVAGTSAVLHAPGAVTEISNPDRNTLSATSQARGSKIDKRADARPAHEHDTVLSRSHARRQLSTRELQNSKKPRRGCLDIERPDMRSQHIVLPMHVVPHPRAVRAAPACLVTTTGCMNHVLHGTSSLTQRYRLHTSAWDGRSI